MIEEIGTKHPIASFLQYELRLLEAFAKARVCAYACTHTHTHTHGDVKVGGETERKREKTYISQVEMAEDFVEFWIRY